MFVEANTHWYDPAELIKTKDMAPDADAVLTNPEMEGFRVCPCPYCGGVLKPGRDTK